MKKIFLMACFFLGLHSAASAQVKVGTNPTTVGSNSNVEVEAPNGGKFTVTKDSAKVIIRDGSQGAGKILVSDGNGKASWKTPQENNFAQLILRAYNPTVVQLSGAEYTPTVNFVSGNGTNYNASTSTYTVTEAGFYEYNVSLEVIGAGLGSPNSMFTINSSIGIFDGPMRGSATTLAYNTRSISGVKYFESGQQIRFSVSRASNEPFDTDWKLRRVSILIYKR